MFPLQQPPRDPMEAQQPGFGQRVAGWVQGAKNVAARLAAALQAKERSDVPQYAPTPDEAVVLRMLDEPKKIRRYTLDALGPNWERSILYASGVQHLIYDQLTKSYRKQRQQDWVPLPVENHVQGKVQRAVDFFTRNRPQGEVVPNSNGQDDVDAAELAEQARKDNWDRNDRDSDLREAAHWLVTTGNVFDKTHLDTTLRSAIRLPRLTESMEPVLDEMGQPVPGLDGAPVFTRRVVEARGPDGAVLIDSIPQGEVCHRILGPMSVTVPVGLTGRLRRSPWILEAGLYPLADLRQLYPDKAEWIGDKGQAVTSDLLTHGRLTSVVRQGVTGAFRSLEPYVLEGYGVVFFLERAPDPDFPNGVLLVEYNGIPLLIDDLPCSTEQDGAEYSYEHAGYYPVPGQFWHRGMVEDAIGPQDSINRLEQALQVNDAFNAMPQWLVPEEGKTAEGAIKNKPGVTIKYKNGVVGKPERIAGMPMGAEFVARKAGYVDTMDRTTAVRDVLMGDKPPGVSAFVAINALGEDAEATFEPIVKDWDRFIERTETKGLRFMQKYYHEARLLTVRGDDGSLAEIKDFIGAQLRGNTRFRMESGSYRPRSKAGQQAMILEGLQKGLFADLQMDPRQLEQIREKVGVAGFKGPKSLDVEMARRENEMLQRSVGWEQVARHTSDDDLLHHLIHEELQKTPAFRRLPNEVQMRVVMHDIQHLMALQETGGASAGTLADFANEDAAEPVNEPGKPGEATGGTEEQGAAVQ